MIKGKAMTEDVPDQLGGQVVQGDRELPQHPGHMFHGRVLLRQLMQNPVGEGSAGGQFGGLHQGAGAAAAAVVDDDGMQEVRIIERVGVREWI